jgi:hypothetical protein
MDHMPVRTAIKMRTLATERPSWVPNWRTQMKLSHLLMTTSLCAVVAMPALAQSRTFSEVDTNGDGRLSQTELESAFDAAGATAFLNQNDRDGSGSVSIAEIQISQDDESDDDDDDNGSDESDDDDRGSNNISNDDSDDDDDDNGSDESDDDDRGSNKNSSDESDDDDDDDDDD